MLVSSPQENPTDSVSLLSGRRIIPETIGIDEEEEVGPPPSLGDVLEELRALRKVVVQQDKHMKEQDKTLKILNSKVDKVHINVKEVVTQLEKVSFY